MRKSKSAAPGVGWKGAAVRRKRRSRLERDAEALYFANLVMWLELGMEPEKAHRRALEAMREQITKALESVAVTGGANASAE